MGHPFSHQGRGPLHYFRKHALGRCWNNGGQASELCQNNTNTDTQTQHRLTDPQLEVIETVLVDLLQLVPQGKRELNQRFQVPPVAG